MFFYLSLTGADQKVTQSLEESISSALRSEVVALLKISGVFFVFLSSLLIFKVQSKTLLHFPKAIEGLPRQPPSLHQYVSLFSSVRLLLQQKSLPHSPREHILSGTTSSLSCAHPLLFSLLLLRLHLHCRQTCLSKLQRLLCLFFGDAAVLCGRLCADISLQRSRNGSGGKKSRRHDVH